MTMTRWKWGRRCAARAVQGAAAVCFAGAALAQDATQAGPRGLSRDVSSAERVVVAGVSNRLNIRSTPALDGAIVARARVGTTFVNSGCEVHGTRTWCALTFLDDSGRQGWAAAEFLEPVTARSRAKQGEFDRIGKLECRPAGQSDWARCDYGLSRGSAGTAALIVYVTAETEPMMLWDGSGLWLAGEEDDALLVSDTLGGVVTVAPEGHGIRVPIALFSES